MRNAVREMRKVKIYKGRKRNLPAFLCEDITVVGPGRKSQSHRSLWCADQLRQRCDVLD